jgi:signal peptidase II
MKSQFFEKPFLLFFLSIIGFFIVLFDEIIKYLFLFYPEKMIIHLPFDFFQLGLYKNSGIAFDIPLTYSIVILVTLFIIFYFAFSCYISLKTNPFLSFIYTLIIFGASGNLYDRLVYGFTVDYLLLFHWSAFNLSDLCIIIGILLLLREKMHVRKSIPIDN